MRTCRPRFLALGLFLLLLPLTAWAALAPVGAPLVIADDPLFCAFDTDVEVIATPKGAFEVVWVDETNFDVRGLRFARNLQPTGPTRRIMPLQGPLLFITDFASTWAGGPYELAINTLDFDNNPGDPLTAYRTQVGLGGVPFGPANRVKPPRFIHLAPAAGGDSLQFRFEPPHFGPNTCRSEGLLASRVTRAGAPLTAESRVNRRASAWGGRFLDVDHLPDDTFIAVYSTCQQFLGLVARRLNAFGAPVGKPFDLPLPGRVNVFSPGVSLIVAARGAADFAVGSMVFAQTNETSGTYISAVASGEVFGPIRISGPSGFASLIDLAASPSGGYLLLFQRGGRLFAQELDAEGVPQDEPLEFPEADGFDIVNASAASLPNGRWIVITRSQHAVPDVSCEERVRGIVLAGE